VEPIASEAWLPDVERRRFALETGVEVALLDWGGDGPLVLCHHANGFCAGVWGLVAARLRERFRVVAYDARGHGDSSRPEGAAAYQWDRFAEDLVAVAARLVDEQGGGPVALGLGHSFGGTSMLGAAARRPGLFRRLVLVDPVVPSPPASGADPARAARSSRLVQGARRRVQVFPSREAARARWSGRSLFRHWAPRALDLYVVHGLRERADGRVELKCPGAVEATIFSNAHLDVFTLAERVQTPTLVLWARDGDFPRAVHERLAASLPHGRLQTLEAGHLAVMERPDLVVEATLRFHDQLG
jgi:pimeloyl-ACP methyl ester carboxylesterase